MRAVLAFLCWVARAGDGVCAPVGREWVSECKHMVWLALLLPVFAVG